MIEPKTPMDEMARLVDLHGLGILDTPAEERFDRLARMAQRYFGVETCLVSLVDADRQWFKSRQGLATDETPRTVSFCGHTILDETAFIVTDTHEDARFSDNPLVTGEPHIRFYAGYPVHSPNGHRIGTLCLIDPTPRSFSHEDTETLRDLAGMVDDELLAASLEATDELTETSNTRGFSAMGSQMLDLAAHSDTNLELLWFELDGVSAACDANCDAAGERKLRRFARLLLRCFGHDDIVARVGHDEFAVMTCGHASLGEAALKRLAAAAARDQTTDDMRLCWRAGLALFERTQHDSLDALVAAARANVGITNCAVPCGDGAHDTRIRDNVRGA